MIQLIINNNINRINALPIIDDKILEGVSSFDFNTLKIPAEVIIRLKYNRTTPRRKVNSKKNDVVISIMENE